MDGFGHGGSINPKIGLFKPGNADGLSVASLAMGRPKRPKTPGELRTLVAKRIRVAMDRVFASESNRPKALAGAAGVSLSTIQRIIDGESGASVDTLETVAAALRMSIEEIVSSSPVDELSPTQFGDDPAERERYRLRVDRYLSRSRGEPPPGAPSTSPAGKTDSSKDVLPLAYPEWVQEFLSLHSLFTEEDRYTLYLLVDEVKQRAVDKAGERLASARERARRMTAREGEGGK